jgi:hypothetical protein
MKKIRNRTPVEKSAKIMALLSMFLITIPCGLGAERPEDINPEYVEAVNVHNLPQNIPGDVEKWVDYMRLRSANTVSYRSNATDSRLQHHVEFQAIHNDSLHQTSLEACFYFQDGQDRVNVASSNENVKIIQHRELPDVHRLHDPLKRHYQGQIRAVNAVRVKYELPCFVLGIPELEFDHSYVSQKLDCGIEYAATLTEPRPGVLRYGYYNVKASAQILPSHYLYSNGNHFFLTRHISEEWISLNDGLVNNRTPVRYVMHTPYPLTLDSFQFINLSGEPATFPKKGLYVLAGNEWKLCEEGEGNVFRYKLLPTNNQVNQAAFPCVTLNFSNDTSLSDFLLDISNSVVLYPFVKSIKFPDGMLPTNKLSTFIGLLSLKGKLPNLNELCVGGRNLLEESRNLLALINNSPPETLRGRDAFDELFTRQRKQNILGVFLEGFDFSGRDTTAQKTILESVMIFTPYITNLTLKKCGSFIESYLPHLFQGQLLHANFQGCIGLPNNVANLIGGVNPGLESLDLSGTSINYIGTKEAPLVFPLLQKLVLNDCLSLCGAHLNAPNLGTLFLNEDRLLEHLTVLGTHLKQISCRNTRIKEESLYEIFKQTKQYIDLDLTGCSQLTLIGQRVFLSLNNENQKTAVLANENLMDSAARVLAVSKTLTSLNLSGNSIGGPGILAFCSNVFLTILKLDRNKIGNVGAQAVAELLRQNRMIQRLYLDHNLIEDEGAQAIAQVLGQNTTLMILDLTYNRISETLKSTLRTSKSQTLKGPDL